MVQCHIGRVPPHAWLSSWAPWDVGGSITCLFHSHWVHHHHSLGNFWEKSVSSPFLLRFSCSSQGRSGFPRPGWMNHRSSLLSILSNVRKYINDQITAHSIRWPGEKWRKFGPWEAAIKCESTAYYTPPLQNVAASLQDSFSWINLILRPRRARFNKDFWHFSR